MLKIISKANGKLVFKREHGDECEIYHKHPTLSQLTSDELLIAILQKIDGFVQEFNLYTINFN
jgi:hypothetical protein